MTKLETRRLILDYGIVITLIEVITFTELTRGVNLINILQAAFTCLDPQSAIKDSQVVNLFGTFGICAHTSCS
jgi:hypothetical protein